MLVPNNLFVVVDRSYAFVKLKTEVSRKKGYIVNAGTKQLLCYWHYCTILMMLLFTLIGFT